MLPIRARDRDPSPGAAPAVEGSSFSSRQLARHKPAFMCRWPSLGLDLGFVQEAGTRGGLGGLPGPRGCSGRGFPVPCPLNTSDNHRALSTGSPIDGQPYRRATLAKPHKCIGFGEGCSPIGCRSKQPWLRHSEIYVSMWLQLMWQK